MTLLAILSRIVEFALPRPELSALSDSLRFAPLNSGGEDASGRDGGDDGMRLDAAEDRLLVCVGAPPAVADEEGKSRMRAFPLLAEEMRGGDCVANGSIAMSSFGSSVKVVLARLELSTGALDGVEICAVCTNLALSCPTTIRPCRRSVLTGIISRLSGSSRTRPVEERYATDSVSISTLRLDRLMVWSCKIR